MAEEKSPKTPKKKPTKKSPAQNRLESLRERLYTRGEKGEARGRTGLSPRKQVAVANEWEEKPKAIYEEMPTEAPKTSIKQEPLQKTTERYSALGPQTPPPPMPKKKSLIGGYRAKLLLAGIAFFTGTLLISGLFLVFGNNSISGENISIDVTGPFAVGGGDTLSLGIALSNENAVPIESATLIIDYPVGSQSVGEKGKELFTERRQLANIEPGEVHNVSAEALVFGEENAEKIVQVSIEYRVRGSNATFYKEAKPYRFKISSSPVVLDVDSVKSISSGQETEFTLTVGSNSSTPLSDVLVQAEYPFGFDFSSANPSPSSGNDTWLIEALDPEETKTITVRGVVTGNQDEDKNFNFSVGVPNERDRFTLSSVFSTVSNEVSIEAPFLGVDVSVNNDTSDTVVVDKSAPIQVRVTFTNTLDDTIYDGGVEVKLSGSAVSGLDVDAGKGFYSSASRTITYDAVGVNSLEQVTPGDSSFVSFTLKPDKDIAATPEIQLAVTVKGKRVFEDRVPESIEATAARTIRVASVPDISGIVGYDETVFTNTGPVPPVAEETTTYTVQFTASGGSNDLTDAVMTATLPQYITWLGNISGGDITYNSSNRTVTWDIGSLSSGSNKSVSAQLGFTPSTSQIGAIPTLVETQRLRGTDRFTGTTVRSDSPALTTAIGGDVSSGRVQAN